MSQDEPGRFKGLSHPSLSEDGRSFRVDVETSQGPVPLEADVDQIGQMIHLLARVSQASAQLRALPRNFPREGSLKLRPIPAQAMAVSDGPADQALVLMLVGASPLAFSLERRLLDGFARELSAMVGRLPEEPDPAV